MGVKQKIRATAMKWAPTKHVYQWLERTKHGALMRRYRRAPINNRLILFESYKGKSCACSPKAIYEAMLRDDYFADREFVWIFNDVRGRESLAQNPRTRVTHRLSPLHIEAALTASLIVTNSRIERVMLPREGQFVLQTWHGTPLKRLGCDICVGGADGESLEKIHQGYIRDGELLSALITPSPYGSLHLASAFGLSDRPDKIWETGYPRNDFLYNYTVEDALRIKQKLGIPSDKKVILYAPTFRDVGYVAGEGFVNKIYADIDSLRARFGTDCVLIMRMHYFVAKGTDYKLPADFVIDGNAVDEINELYVISDVLVTDYSSVMYDYAALKRPMIFFMPDMEEYKTNLRDFYMDVHELPGPITTSQSELEDALVKALQRVNTGEQCDYADFLAKFQPYEDGRRSEEVLRRLKERGL